MTTLFDGSDKSPEALVALSRALNELPEGTEIRVVNESGEVFLLLRVGGRGRDGGLYYPGDLVVAIDDVVFDGDVAWVEVV